MAYNQPNKKGKLDSFFENKTAAVITAVLILLILFIAAFTITVFVVRGNEQNEPGSVSVHVPGTTLPDESGAVIPYDPVSETTGTGDPQNGDATTLPGMQATITTTEPTTQGALPSAGTIAYPSDTASWQMICLNKNRCVDSSYENTLSLSYVAGSGEQMDSRAAAAYEQMYAAAAQDGIYLTPCSGYRSYSTQKRLFNEFYNEYLAQGYSREEAYNLTSTRRNPPGSSEHNIGICMDIICASSSANFENTRAYAWLQNNAASYGFILRYPADKMSVTGVKFEPWHWRYVGVDNARAIQASGLCLEEYLGLA